MKKLTLLLIMITFIIVTIIPGFAQEDNKNRRSLQNGFKPSNANCLFFYKAAESIMDSRQKGGSLKNEKEFIYSLNQHPQINHILISLSIDAHKKPIINDDLDKEFAAATFADKAYFECYDGFPGRYSKSGSGSPLKQNITKLVDKYSGDFSTESLDEYCGTLEKMAITIMKDRYAGVPIDDIIKIIKDDEYYDVTKAMIIERYNRPIPSTKEYQKSAIGYFRARVSFKCLSDINALEKKALKKSTSP